MRKFIYLIGSTDDFDSLEDLKTCYFSGDHDFSQYNASAFTFDLPANCDNEIALMYGRGLAFSNDWCIDDTVSTLLEA